MSTRRQPSGRSAKQKPSGREAADKGKLARELAGLFAIFCGLLLILSLATFDGRDPWLNHVISGVTRIHNKAGLFGAYLAGFLYDVAGVAAWMAPALLCTVGARRILGIPGWPWWRWTGAALCALCLSFVGAAYDFRAGAEAAELGAASRHGGGVIGHFLYKGLVGWLNPTGSLLVWIFALMLATQMLFGFSWLQLLAAGGASLWRSARAMVENIAARPVPVREEKDRASRRGPAALPVIRERAALSASDKDAADEEPDSLPAFLPEAGPDPFAPRAETRSPFGSDDLLPDLAGGEDDPETEDALPPWVRDFEQGRLGVHAPESAAATLPPQADETGVAPDASVPAQAPTCSPAIEDEDADEAQEDPLPDTVEVREKGVVTPAEEPEPRGLLATALSSLKRKKDIPLPPLSLLEAAPATVGATPRSVLEAKGRAVMTCLTDFGIQGELVGITPGPVVTMFEVRPAPGVRVSRIANLSDDLALALKAVAVRIQAPVPGTDTVGIEIPNDTREVVCLRELIGSQAFQSSPSLLTLAVGKDIAGGPAVADLATMPHLLVAGATGAGKSVGINSIILSILFKAKPEEVKLLLVDPKRVEMAIYADLPHLVHPVVTEMQMAKNALEWAVNEMERRYGDIAKAGVRNIADYNARLREYGEERPEGLEDLEIMPYLVLVIDELADLMLVAAKEVETSIVRLAQLARAAGIHLILATQRPSVDVVTGLIKANFPCRISFQVTSKHDSRTILDSTGAEHLLGRGDMLFKPAGGKFRRLHGAFVSDRNVLAVVDYWRSRQKPDYRLDFSEWGAEEGGFGGAGGTGGGDVSSDPMYAEAVDFVRQQGKASISLIQRKFRIGFNKAARLVEQMEQDGIIGPADGSKPRTVIR